MGIEMNIENVTRVYAGKSGCACGCRGVYTERGQYPGAAKRIEKIFNLITEGDYDIGSNNIAVEIDGKLFIAYDD